jgi:outer membrane receptor for ferric coprogen and ferric-rhodotorulic acid
MTNVRPNTSIKIKAKSTVKNKTNKTKLSALYCAISLALLPVTSLISMPVQAQQLANQHAFNIKAGAMAQALRNFASQAGISISFKDHMLSGIKSNGLQGSYGVDAGLEKLLLNAPLNFRASGSNAFIIEKRRANVLATAQVIDKTLGSNTEGTGSYTTGNMASATGLNLSMRETPQSVSVVTSQLIQDKNLRTLTDVVYSSAGVSAKESDSARHRFSARGFTIDNYQIDGIAIPVASAGELGESQTDTAIYERIEIVRGATGLLTGTGEPSAAINLIRKRANSKEFVAITNAGIGRWNTFQGMVDVSTSLNSEGNIRTRIVVNYQDGDSYVNLASNNTTTFYGIVEADITKNTLLSIGASYQDNDPTSSTWGGLAPWHSDGTRTDWDRSKTMAASWTYWATTNKNYFANLSHEFANGWQAKINLNHIDDTADMQLLYTYGVVDKITGLGLNPYPYKGNRNRKQNDIGLNLSGNFELFDREQKLTFGVTHSNQDIIANGYSGENVNPLGDFYQWDGSYTEPTWVNPSVAEETNIKQTAFYAASRLSLTDEVNVIIGARVSNWEKSAVYSTPRDIDENTVLTPYAGILYDFNNTHTAYASYTDIFKPQEYKNSKGNDLKPLVGNSYEIGLKSELFTGLLNTNIALFKIDQDNLAEKDGDQTVPGSTPPAQAYKGVQGATSEGVEFEVIGEILPGWNVSMSYTQFTAENAEGGEINTYQPSKLFKLYSSYHFTGAWNKLTIAGGLNWEDSSYTESENPISKQPENFTQKAYSLVSTMARYQFNDKLSAQLNIDNLFDKTYYSQIGFFSQLAYGKPRDVKLSVNYQF